MPGHTESGAAPLLRRHPDELLVGLVSVSDRASSGVYRDEGLPALQGWLESALVGPCQCATRLIPDERQLISATLAELVDRVGCDLVLTTGGTGPARRDVTPEATLDVATREMPGFGEQMRQISLRFVPTAILSRQVAVIRDTGSHAALIINLRYLLLTATLRPLYPDKNLWRGALSMYLVTDENWAMTVAAMARGQGSVAFLMGGGVLAGASWISTNLIGYGLGSAIDDPTRWGLDFAFTATFLALLLGMWKGRADLVPWMVAALAAIVTSRLVDGSWHILVGGVVGSLVGAFLETRKHAHQS